MMNTHYSGPYQDNQIKPGSLVMDHYFIQNRIDRGHNSCIFLAINLDDGESYVLKAFLKKDLLEKEGQQLMVQRERRIHLQMKHQNIIRLYRVEEDQNYLFFLMEYAERGEFFHYLVERGSFSEKEAARFFLPLLRAMHYCHLKGVMHRDIKPENLLLTHDFKVKLADFGWAILAEKSKELCGTIEYLAPEIIRNLNYDQEEKGLSYDYKVDIWSLGVLLYEFLYGFPPFQGKVRADTMNEILFRDLTFPDEPPISDDAIDLLRRLLDKDPKTRMSYMDLLLNSWVSKYWNTPFPQTPKDSTTSPSHRRSLSTDK